MAKCEVRIALDRASRAYRGGEEVSGTVTTIKSHKETMEPNVGIDIFDRLGNLVFASGSTLQQQPLPPMEKDREICVAFKITFAVQPGTYTYSLTAAEPSDDPDPNIGFVHDRLENVGSLAVNHDRTRLLPFYGFALLPTGISFSSPYDYRAVNEYPKSLQ